ncbi:neurobeachin-like protein 1 isoform X2 [Lineus longissimus]|uniref:neurobeachin-like protein 1 isoform X2 n=1 Tax=Lineus longissimus TaxID=88925 RepID=UPI00315CF568
MENQIEDEKLYQLWMRYMSKNDEEYLQSYLSCFLETYEEFVDLQHKHLNEGFTDEGPHLTRLPEGILQALSKHLHDCSEKTSTNGVNKDTIEYAEKLTKCLVIICRNIDNVAFVASCEYVTYLVSLAISTILQLAVDESPGKEELTSFLRHVLHFFECLYDPYFVWRKRLKGWKVDKKRFRLKPALLHVEVVPFFYECFNNIKLDIVLQTELFHVYGGIISGAQHNALRAISPATMDVCMKLLSSNNTPGPTNEYREDIAKLKELILKCLQRTVHVLHAASPDQRQVEVSTIIEGYLTVMSRLGTAPETRLALPMLQTMLDSIVDMMTCKDRIGLQAIFAGAGTFESFVSLLLKTTFTGPEAHHLAMSMMKSMGSLMQGSQSAKELFKNKVGYSKFVEALKSLGQPSMELLKSVLSLVVECEFTIDKPQVIHNRQAALMLVHWLPDIQSHDLQIWLSECLCFLGDASIHNKMQFTSEGMIAAILNVLSRQKQINPKAIGNLLNLLETLGTYSISATELKQLIHLLRTDDDDQQNPYCGRIMQAMSVMARKDGREGALYYFDITESHAGIAIPGIRKWPSGGFSFHAWVSLDTMSNSQEVTHRDHLGSQPHRRQLYSFFTGGGAGFEAFFTEQCVLVVGVVTKKDYHAVSLSEHPLNDQQWHCIEITHTGARRPFSQSQLSVYIDGKLKLNSQLKMPSVAEPITICRIGTYGPGMLNYDGTFEVCHPSTVPETKPRSHSLKFLLPSNWAPAANSTAVTTIPAGTQDTVWGTPICLKGRLGSVCVFQDALQPGQVKGLYSLGPNCLTPFRSDESEIAELGNKVLVYYNAKACMNGSCLDLSPNQHHGQFTGTQCVTWDIKDVINCVGGIQVLFPLLEHVVEGGLAPPIEQVEPELERQDTVQSDSASDDWEVVPTFAARDAKLQQNQVAAFLTLLRTMIQCSTVNQEVMIRTNSVAIIGTLLQKVGPSLVDVHVLMAVQLLVEAIMHTNKTLLHHVYQYLLFDFRIWSKSDFPVRIGHIQYLSTIIKDDKKFFRKKYGVQYMLDIIRTNYSELLTDFGFEFSAEDTKSIRASLFGLIKYYILKDITIEELTQIMAFIHTVRDEKLIADVLDMLAVLLEQPHHGDQLHLLMFEPEMGESLYSLLTNTEYSTDLKEKVLKVTGILLKTDKVYDKNKGRLRLQETGYLGLIQLLQGQPTSVQMITLLLDQILLSDSATAFNGVLGVLYLVHNSDVDTKLEASKRLLAALFQGGKDLGAKHIAKQLAWQEVIVKLFVLRPNTVNASLSEAMMNPVLSPIAYSADSNDTETMTSKSSSSSLEQNSTHGALDASLIARPSSANRSRPKDLPLNRDLVTEKSDLNYGTPVCTTPQFMRTKFFDDLESADDDVDAPPHGRLSFDQFESRSPSTSFEDLTLQNRSSQSLTNLLPEGAGDGEYVVQDGVADLEVGGDGDIVVEQLKQLGVVLERSESAERAEELCQNLLIILFTILWKGVEGSGKTAWKERGQVFSCLELVREKNTLIRPYEEIKRRLLEMLVQACLGELKEAGHVVAGQSENAFELVRLVYDFILILGRHGTDPNRFSERLIEDVSGLLEVLSVWGEESEWTEMAQLGFSIILEYAAQEDLELCAEASARLHVLVQTRPLQKLNEACFILGSLNNILSKALDVEKEHYSFLIPVMKALLEKCHDLLSLSAYLPSLPSTTASPTFFDDFKVYSRSEEWANFIAKQVDPSMQQFMSNCFDELQVNLKLFWTECHEQVMVNSHKRSREKGECKLKFQSHIVEPLKQKVKAEDKRFQSLSIMMRNQHLSTQRLWRANKQFFIGERGSWAERNFPDVHWKLSNQENFLRMRPKLVPNHNFDLHTEAAQLRDNLRIETEQTDISSLLLPLPKVSDENIGDDRLGDEEWNLISSASSIGEEQSGKEKLVLSEDCELITLVDVIKGRLEVTTTHIYFFDLSTNKEDAAGEDLKFSLSQLREIHFRRYNLRRSALELFLIDQTNYFFNFQKKIRNKVYGRIVSLRPSNMVYYGTRSPVELLKASGLTQKWVQREISNFEYLIHLNTIAGRTYNDLSQYPVFPWILMDYTSDELDLDDPAAYRDLSKPVGAVNPKNEADIREKFDNFEDPSGTIEKFHYGTHYSSAAGVMHYLIRLEPFTSLHIQLQSGRFDVADRQFHSIPATWKGIYDNPNDVKELIPEFFYLPEFLENNDGFDLGSLQLSKEGVNHVILPKWASSAEDFINTHRKALESEYVSANLHNWIDLIFGYKQKGPAAADALNVFYYCTYEGAVDLDAISDPVERKALEGMINNFGQTPCQLLREPHPKRLAFEDTINKATKTDKPLSVLNFLDQLKAYFVEASYVNDPLVYAAVPRNQARSFIQQGMPDAMVTVTEDGALGIHGWLPYDKSISNYFTFERDPSLGNPKTKKCLAGPFAPGIKITPNLFVVSHDAKLLFSGGHWDNSLRVYSLTKSKITAQIVRHTDIVSCMDLDYCGSHLITGSKDTTCMIWEITFQSSFSHSVNPRPKQTLYGHDHAVTCVKISIELDMAASASNDGTIIIHTVMKGQYVRTLRPPTEMEQTLAIPLLVTSEIGQVCIFCKQSRESSVEETNWLHVYSVNGKHHVSEKVQQPVSHMVVTGDHLILGDAQGLLTIKELFSLKTLRSISLHVPIQCLALTNGNSHILAGLRDGKLIIVGIKRQCEVK